MKRAHRAAWELVNGPIPEGKIICHHCDIPLCVETTHLFLGTALDNSRDCVKKGRLLVRERHGRAKLTEVEVREIRRLKSKFSKVTLAKIFEVSDSAISHIHANRRWKEA